MRFRELLKAAGINQSELGRRLGLTRQTVSRWGNGAPEYAEAYLRLLIEYNRINRL